MILLKRILLSLLIVLLFSSCSTFTNQMEVSEVKEIKISEFENFGSINRDFIKTITDKEDIKNVVKALNSKSKVHGAVDMPEGDFDLLLIFEDSSEEAYHLWIDSSSATVMQPDDTHTIYNISSKNAEKINQALK